jgi:hypothetical protein
MQQCRTIPLLRNRAPMSCYQGNLTCNIILNYTSLLICYDIVYSVIMLICRVCKQCQFTVYYSLWCYLHIPVLMFQVVFTHVLVLLYIVRCSGVTCVSFLMSCLLWTDVTRVFRSWCVLSLCCSSGSYSTVCGVYLFCEYKLHHRAQCHVTLSVV